MDRLLIRQLHTRLDELDGYRKSLIATSRLAETDLSHVPRNIARLIEELSHSTTRGIRKRLDYSGLMVSLYGILEDYVERITEHGAEVLNSSVGRYKDLPKQMRDYHERLSLRLIEKIRHPSYAGVLTVDGVIANLHGCLSGDRPFELNVQAFALHSSNVRHATVREMLAGVAVHAIDDAVARDNRTRRLLESLGRSEGEPHYYIDDLADRRNMIAHGEAPPDVLSLSMISEYIRAVGVFCEALFDHTLLALCETAIPQNATPLGIPTRTYRSGRIVCFAPTNPFTVKVGDIVLWGTSDGWRLARIDTLEVDRNKLNHLVGVAETRFGAGIGANGHSRSGYWVIPG